MRLSWLLVAGCVIALSTAAAAPAQPPPPDPPPTPALERPMVVNAGDTHVYASNLQLTVDCNNATLIVTGSYNIVNAAGSCFAVTTQGTGNTVIAENVVNNITVYGFDQTVLYKNGNPYVWDRGRELGMVNRIDRI